MNNDIQAYNENSWEELCWAIANSSGEFSLILAHCNSANLQRRLTQRLQGSCEVEIQEIVLDKSTKRLYQTIQGELAGSQPQALIIFGLESVKALDSLLISANQIREEFRKNFPFPIVLWVTDEVLQKLIRLAHDLQTWTTTVKFAIATEDLTQIIQETADEVQQRRLAGTGRAQEHGERALRHIQRHPAQCCHAGKAVAHVFDLDRAHCAASDRRAKARRKNTSTNTTTTTETATTQTVEFLDTGTQLHLRPFVTRDNL
ncbi:MAG: hypothetical protein AAFX80_15190, partial [Cyanobacteria bacterium J06639_18]